FGNALSQLGGERFAVGVGDRMLSEFYDRGVLFDLKKPPQMGEKTDIGPPAGGLARRWRAGRRAVGNRRIRDGNATAGGKFEERRVKRKHLFALCACAFRKDDHAFAGVETSHNFLAGPGNVAAVFSIDKDRAKITADPACQKPVLNFTLCDKYSFYDRPQRPD